MSVAIKAGGTRHPSSVTFLTRLNLRCLLAASEHAWIAFTGFTFESASTRGEVGAAAKVSAILLAGASPMPKLHKHSQTNSVARYRPNLRERAMADLRCLL